MPTDALTPKQRAALETIRKNGGYACLNTTEPPRWLCAERDALGYRWDLPTLPTTVMEELREAGIIRRAPGPRRDGPRLFWEIAEDA